VACKERNAKHQCKLRRIINGIKAGKQLVMQLFYKMDLEFPEDHKVHRIKYQTAVKNRNKKTF